MSTERPITFTVEVTHEVTVTLDETKFDDAFFAQFNKSITYLGDNEERDWALRQHAEHLACLMVENDFGDNEFVEGYGPLPSMGIRLRSEFLVADVVSREDGE